MHDRHCTVDDARSVAGEGHGPWKPEPIFDSLDRFTWLLAASGGWLGERKRDSVLPQGERFTQSGRRSWLRWIASC